MLELFFAVVYYGFYLGGPLLFVGLCIGSALGGAEIVNDIHDKWELEDELDDLDLDDEDDL
jgi:hypothetical protein